MKMLWVLAVLVTPLTLSYAIQTEYFVKPDNSTPCPGFPCHSLSHYLESTTQYFVSNTRISFLPGVHEIDKVSVLYIKNASNLTLAGYNVLRSHAAKIVCRRPAVLKFRNIANLVIMHLSVVYCGYLDITERSGANISYIVAVFLMDVTSVKLSNISVENSTGYGVLGMNILGNSSVSHSRFIFNNYYILSSTNCSHNGLGRGSTCLGGNMLLLYDIDIEQQPESAANITGSTSVLSIDSCVFSDGVDVSNIDIGGGLAILVMTIKHNVDISIWNVVSTNNMVTNFLIVIHNNMGTTKFNITNITSSMGNNLHPQDEAPYGTGFRFFCGGSIPFVPIPTTSQTYLNISDSKFYDNNGGSVHLQLYELHKNVKFYVIISNCSFRKNVNPNGKGVITAYNLRHLKIINCAFTMNKQTALQSLDSTLYFGGHIIFSGNNGTLGGAMVLQGGSTFYLMPHTHVEIINNHAKRGGGIYVEDENPQVRGGGIYPENGFGRLYYLRACFFQVLEYPHYSDPVVTIENNTADEAGSAIYGGNIDNCCISFVICNTFARRMFAMLFKILDLPSHISQISSNPFEVHVCNHSISETHGAHVYPGQAFKVSVVLYGQQNGSVAGIVRANLVNKSRDAHFAPLQETQETGYLCKNLTYTIFSTGQNETIMLRVDGVHFYANELGALINVTLLPCPPGFQLSNITAQCECDPMLQDRGLRCNISGATPLVQRTRSTWISTHHNGSDIILHDHCPLNYCKPTRLWLRLDHPDEQCAHGRSGILCGRCNSNLSLTIGTSQCLECTKTYLVLLVPFALAGLMLVLLLIICNLTVSMGTINGLIFYANIVWINNANFIKTTNIFGVRVFQQVLIVFIAWLNLDLGIETCFFHGMDVYIQTWLQFAFPFYIWTLVGVIIYLSRRSITMVKLVGSSAVSVLATLFLLSYAKLQRTVITAFSPTYVQNYYEDGRSLAVWLYDGNIPFLQGKHIALFLMALAVTLLFILPFTLLLLFAPCIQASNHFLVQWVKMKLNPLLDAYQGPYKDKFRFWTGLMLVVRSILLMGFGLNILGDPDIDNLLIIVVLTCLIVGTGIRGIVYKNTLFHVTEMSFISNLIILSGWTIYNRHRPTGDSVAGQAALVCTSTGVAFATFTCILTYHTYLCLKSRKLHLYFRRRPIEGGGGREREAVQGSVESAVDAPPKCPPTVTMIELREPLLTDN